MKMEIMNVKNVGTCVWNAKAIHLPPLLYVLNAMLINQLITDKIFQVRIAHVSLIFMMMVVMLFVNHATTLASRVLGLIQINV
jgi:hypothetical protein